MRCILHLPATTAIPAIVVLSVALPIKAVLHIRTITLFNSIVAADTNIPPAIYIHKCSIRQLAIHKHASTSCIII